MTAPRAPARHVRRTRCALTCWAIVAAGVVVGSAGAQTWSWFVEPFSVGMIMEHPETGRSEGTLTVGPADVRLELTQLGVSQVLLLRLLDDGVLMRALMPEGFYVEQVLAFDAVPELVDEGYVVPVTAPDHADHPCVTTPEIHRCRFVGDATIDGRPVERWRIEAASGGQDFYFDRGAGVLVRSEDDTGVVITYTSHRTGPPADELFEVPAGYQRVDVPIPPPAR